MNKNNDLSEVSALNSAKAVKQILNTEKEIYEKTKGQMHRNNLKVKNSEFKKTTLDKFRVDNGTFYDNQFNDLKISFRRESVLEQ